MLDTIIGALLKWALNWLTGWEQRRKLASETQRADKAEAQVQADEHTIAAGKIREKTEHEAQNLPEVPAQRVGDAVPQSAAGQLRDGWSR
ncbi:MAG: hypothetical protein ACTHMO_03795 [Rhodanobacteraceae bacterium]